MERLNTQSPASPLLDEGCYAPPPTKPRTNRPLTNGGFNPETGTLEGVQEEAAAMLAGEETLSKMADDAVRRSHALWRRI